MFVLLVFWESKSSFREKANHWLLLNINLLVVHEELCETNYVGPMHFLFTPSFIYFSVSTTGVATGTAKSARTNFTK